MKKPILIILSTITIGAIYMSLFNDTKLLELIKNSKSNQGSDFINHNSYNSLGISEDNIDETYLLNADIRKINLIDVSAYESNWSNVLIESGQIQSSVFSDSIFNNVTFKKVRFLNSNFSGSTFNNVQFIDCEIIDQRGIHNFGKSFNGLKNSTVTFINTKLEGILMGFSQGTFKFDRVHSNESTLGAMQSPSNISIVDSSFKWMIGDNASLNSLTIENSTFYDSKFNDIKAAEVSLIKVKGELPVTGELGNVTVRHLETDNGRALFLGTGTINNLSVSACNKDTELNLMYATVYNVEINSCNLDIFETPKTKFGFISISDSTFNKMDLSETISKNLKFTNVTVNDEITADLTTADEFALENFKLSPNAKIDTTGSNIEWKENARSEKK